ncbi:uncharacterized protein y4hQ-like [Daktulosphaira vitifoliae]|uniref:uncharacterized protein y4hQ-like n=1 Tax=Daktulosphaira vitifoliae TaxID=58002 RepID=UPI0021AA73A5|nr:uncharacterized protein y4hQ-like [Daktulosphaira vitifoliae]
MSASIIFQFKITLKRIKPNIWRRIQVPGNFTFWELHMAISDAMGWQDYHLHQFEVLNPRNGQIVLIGTPDDFGLVEVINGKTVKIADFFSAPKCKAKYEYDFGDGWDHEILLQKILPAIPTVEYPICVGGKRACPPEDCGGTWGYGELLSIISNPNHGEYEERKDWLKLIGYTNGEFDSEHFDPKSVYFRSFRDSWNQRNFIPL